MCVYARIAQANGWVASIEYNRAKFAEASPTRVSVEIRAPPRASCATAMEQSSRPLSILQVASGFPAWGGTELHLLNLSHQLKLRGHNVTVACRPDGWVFNKATEMGLPTLPATVLRQQDWTDYKIFRDW